MSNVHVTIDKTEEIEVTQAPYSVQVVLSLIVVAGCTLPVRALAAKRRDPFADLTLATMPSVGQVIEAGLDHLPSSVGKSVNWSKRMHMSALLPVFQVRYRAFESNYDRFDYRTQYTTRTTRGSSTDEDDTSRVHATPGSSYFDSSDGGSASWEHYADAKYPVQYSLEDGIRELHDQTLVATWDLSTLLYHNDELEAAQVGRFVASFRYDYIRNMADLYRKLKQSLKLLARDPRNPAALEQREIHGVIIDQLTGGYLTKHVNSQLKQAKHATSHAAIADALAVNEGDLGAGPWSHGVDEQRVSAAKNGNFEGLMPSVATVPGTLEDMMREDEEAQEEEQEAEEEESLAEDEE